MFCLRSDVRIIAELGDPSPQFTLCVKYARGEGVAKDFVAKTGRAALDTTMTPDQIAEAQKLSREWKPKKK